MTDSAILKTLSADERELLNHLRERANELEWGAVVDARGLYMPELWDDLPKGERRPLGQLISSWVHQGRLPLEHAGFNSSRHNLYRRI